MIVVSDTTPIISLVKGEQLSILEKLYGKVLVPESVYNELILNDFYRDEVQTIKDCKFLSVHKIQNQNLVDVLKKDVGLDVGEGEALVLYKEQNADLLLMDEHKGRNVAKQMSMRFIGTLGILMLAFDKNLMTANQIEETLSILVDKRLSRNLCNKVLKYIGLSEKF